MKTELSAWQRLERVLCWAGINSSAFASNIGLRSPQSLYQIKASKHGISREMAERISARYPQISTAWLLSGEGEMVLRGRKTIPYYKSDFADVLSSATLPAPDDWVSMPECDDCTLAVTCKTRTMEPDIPQGSVLFCRQISAEDVFAGGIYLFLSGRTPLVRKAETVTDRSVRFGSPAGPATESIEAERTLLGRVYFVKAVLEWKTI